jgi:hypothetical protein
LIGIGGSDPGKKTCRTKRQAINAIENRLTIQLTKRVMSTPLGLRPAFRIAVKSTFIIIGTIMSQMSTAMGS